MMMEIEHELNRAWIYENDEIVGETNFVVPAHWLLDLYNEHFAKKKTSTGEYQYNSFEDFLDVYEPEVEGEFIYQHALEAGVLKEDIGIVMY